MGEDVAMGLVSAVIETKDDVDGIKNIAENGLITMKSITEDITTEFGGDVTRHTSHSNFAEDMLDDMKTFNPQGETEYTVNLQKIETEKRQTEGVHPAEDEQVENPTLSVDYDSIYLTI